MGHLGEAFGRSGIMGMSLATELLGKAQNRANMMGKEPSQQTVLVRQLSTPHEKFEDDSDDDDDDDVSSFFFFFRRVPVLFPLFFLFIYASTSSSARPFFTFDIRRCFVVLTRYNEALPAGLQN